MWGLTQPFTPAPWTRFSAENRSVLFALADGGLWLVNPLPPTDELVEHVASVAAESGNSRVTHVVVPSTSPEHWASAPDVLSRVAPGARLWVPPGFFGRGGRVGGRFIARQAVDALALAAPWTELPAAQGAAPDAWGGEITTAMLRAPGGLTECAFRLTPARTAVTADAAFGLAAADADAAGASWLDRTSSRLAGVYGRVGSPLAPVIWAAGAAGAAFADEAASWAPDVDTLIPMHLSAPWDEGGRRLAAALGRGRRGE